MVEKKDEEKVHHSTEEQVEDEVTTEIVGGNDEDETSGSSLNLDENVAGLLCYLGTFVTGIIFLILEKKSRFVRFHAMQSTVFFVGIWVVYFVVDFLPVIGWLLTSICSLFAFIMWIVLMVKAYQKEFFKLPVVGQIADDFLKKL